LAANKLPFAIDGDGADGSLFVAAGDARRRVCPVLHFIHASRSASLTNSSGLTKLDSLFFGEALRAFGDEHHVRAIFEDLAGDLNGNS